MKFNKQSPLHVVLLCLILIFQFSCSKDSDLLTDYVLADSLDSKVIANLVVDDTYQVSLSGSMVLDVLANDTFENEAVVVITETSTPTNGTVAINNDETLTYTPNAEIIEQVSETSVGEVDTFTYTVEVDNGEGTTTSEEASVVITAGDNAGRQDAVSLQSYGAVGDGVTDDTAAIQNAFDNETNITSDAGKTYLVSSQIRLDQNLTQTIDFNGSKIIRNTPVSYPLYINKGSYAGINTSISNLEIDGNDLNGSLVYIESRVQFTNVNIHDALNNTGSGGIRGIYIRVRNQASAEGQWVFDNVDIDRITHTNFTSGEAQNFYVYQPELVTKGMQIVYKNSTLSNSYGYEANLMILNSPGLDVSFTNNSFWFENLILYNFQRRAVKGFIGNQTWINCDFYSADVDNPEINTSKNPAGLFRLGAGSSALGSENNLFCGCNFYGGYTKPLDAFESSIAVGGVYGTTSFEMRHCTINGDDPNTNWSYNATGIALGEEIGTVKICDCEFTLGSTPSRGNKIWKRNAALDFVGPKMQIDANNTYAIGETAALASINSAYYDIVDLSADCDVCPSIDD